jgi:hypothetical protein
VFIHALYVVKFSSVRDCRHYSHFSLVICNFYTSRSGLMRCTSLSLLGGELLLAHDSGIADLCFLWTLAQKSVHY